MSYNCKHIFAHFLILVASIFYSKDAESQTPLPDPTISINHFDNTDSYAPGSSISIHIKTDGNFPLTNVFELVLSDRNGNFSASSPVIGTRVDFFAPIIVGTLPNGIAAGNGYRLRVRSILSSGTPGPFVDSAPFSIALGNAPHPNGIGINLQNFPNNVVSCLQSDQFFFGFLNRSSNDLTPNSNYRFSINNTNTSDFDYSATLFRTSISGVITEVQLTSTQPNNDIRFSIPSGLPVGFYPIKIKVKNRRTGLVSVQSYTFLYNTGNTGLANLSAENICAGTNVEFIADSSAMSKNYPGSRYKVNFGDCSADVDYTHYQLFNKPLLIKNYRDATCQNACSVSNPSDPNPANRYYSIRLNLLNKGINTSCSTYGQIGNGTTKYVNASVPPSVNFTATSRICKGTNLIATNTTVGGFYGFGNICSREFESTWYIKKPGENSFTAVSDATNRVYGYPNLNYPGIDVNVPGCWEVMLEVKNPQGCETISSITKVINVEQPLTPDFSLSPSGPICFNETVNITDLSGAVTPCTNATFSWSVSPATGWNYTGETTSTSQNPKIRFTFAGTYTITQSITNICGTFTKIKTIDVNGDPSVTIPTGPFSICVLPPSPFTANVDFSNPTYKPTYSAAPYEPTSYSWSVDGPASDYEFVTSSSIALPIIRFKQFRTYNVTVSVNGNCAGANTKTYVFNVKPTPSITNTNINQTICSGNATALTTLTSDLSGTTFAWSVSASPLGSISGFSTPGSGAGIPAVTLTNTTNASASLTYSIVPTNNGCVGNALNMVVTVNPKPVIPAQSQTICSGSSFSVAPAHAQPTVIVPLGTTYTWTVASNTDVDGESDQTTGVSSISQTLTNRTNIVQTVTYTVTPTSVVSGSCAGATFTVTVTVNPKPALGNYTQVICSGGSYSFTPSNGSPSSSTVVPGGTTYSWSAPLVTGISGMVAGTAQSLFSSGTLVNTTNTPIDVVYTLTPSYTNGGVTCSGNTFTVTVTVNPRPVIPAQTATICSGESFTITPVNGTPNVNAIVPSGTTYTWTVAPNSAVDGEGDQATGVTSISQTLTNRTNIAQTLVYTVTPRSGAAGSCVGNAFTVTVTVNPKPLIANRTANACSNALFTVTPSNGGGDIVPAGTIYSWSIPTVTGGMTGGAASNSNATSITGTLLNPTSQSQTAIYTVTPTYTSGGLTCTGPSFTVTVTVGSGSSIQNETRTICSGSSFSVDPSSNTSNVLPSGVTYSWSAPSVGGIDGLVAGSGASTIGGTLSNTTNAPIDVVYNVTPSLAGTCSGGTFTVTVTVNPKPVIPAQSQTICSGSSFSVTPANAQPTVIVPLGTTYTWTVASNTDVDGESDQSTGMSSISQTLTNRTNIAQTVVYTVTPRSGVAGSCIGSTFIVTVTVNPRPAIANMTDAICSNGSFGVTPSSAGGNMLPSTTTYSWSAPSVTGGITGGSSSAPNATSITGTLLNPTNEPQTATYTVTPSYTNDGVTCSGNTFTVTVTVNPKPVIGDYTKVLCSGDIYSFTPSNGSPSPSTIVPNGTKYSWSAPSVTGITGTSSGTGESSFSSGTLTNTTNAPINVVYTLTPSYTNGGLTCTGNAFTVTVTVNPKPLIANRTANACSNALFTVTPSNGGGDIVPAGTIYSWSIPTVTGNMTGGAASTSNATSITGNLLNPASQSQTATYTVTPSYTSGGVTCTGPSFTVTVTVGSGSSIQNETRTICSGSSFSVDPSSNTSNVLPSGVTYSWSAPSVGGIDGLVAGSGASTIGGTLSNTTNAPIDVVYNVTPSLAGSCSGGTFTVTVRVNPMPVIGNYAKVICSDGSHSFTPVNGQPSSTTVVPSGTTYSWSAPSISGISGTIAGTGQSSFSSGTLVNATDAPIDVVYTLTPSYINSGVTCEGSTFTVTVTVNPKPVIGNYAKVICSDGSHSFTPVNGQPSSTTVVPSGTTYSWSAPSVSGISGTMAGTGQSSFSSGTLVNGTNAPIDVLYTLTPSYSNGGVTCSGNTFTVTVTVNPKPVIGDYTKVLCSGDTYSFTPSNGSPSPSTIVPNGTKYSWSAPSVTGITGTSSGTGESSFSSGTLTNTTNAPINVVYTLTPSYTNGGLTCTGNAFTVTVTVNPKPLITNKTANACSNALFSVTPSNGGGDIVPTGTIYSWSIPSVTGGMTGGAASTSNATSITGTLLNPTNEPQTATYTVTPSYTSGGVTCTGPSFTVTVTVKPSPVIPAQAAIICSGNGFSVTPQNAQPTVIVPNGTTYDWSAPVVAGISGTASGTAQSLFSTGSLVNSTNAPIDVVYTVTATSGVQGSCVGKFIVTVTVNPRPSIQSQTTGSCSGQSFTFSPSNGNGSIVPFNTTYTWGTPVVTGNITGGSSGNGNSLNGTLVNPTNRSQTATYTLTPSYSNGGVTCEGSAFAVIVTLSPKPVIPAQEKTICSGELFEVSPVNDEPNIIVPAGTTYRWTVANNPNVTGQSNQLNGPTTISQRLTNNTNNVQTVIYTVTPSVGNNCEGNAFRVTVTVNPKPVIPAQTQTICSGSSFSVTPENAQPNVIVPSGTTYKWTVASNANVDGESDQVTGVASISQTLTNNTNIVQTVVYTVTPTSGDAGSCVGSTFSVTVTVNPKPVIPDQTETICSGNIFTTRPLNGVPSSGVIVPSGTTYTWTVLQNANVEGESNQTNGLTSISQQLTNNTNVVQTVVYTVTPRLGADANCVGNTFTVTVTVNPKPVIPAQTETICSGQVFRITPANAQPSVIVPLNTTYTWTVVDNPNVTGESAQAVGVSSISQALTNNTNAVQTVRYTVTPTSGAQGNCVGNTFTITVTVNPDAKAQYTMDTNIGCAPYLIRDHLTLFPITTANTQPDFRWYANGILIGTGVAVPNYSIAKPGDTVVLKLVAKSLYGCKDDSLSTPIYTIQAPLPSFKLSADTACGPVSILIENTSVPINAINGSRYNWNFGNGQVSSQVQPGSIVFRSNDLTQRDTTYYITLDVSTVCKTFTIRDSVLIRPGPKALFQPDTTVYCSPATMRFRNNSRGVNTSFGETNKYVWDWGDGRRDTVYDNRTMIKKYTTNILDTILVKLYAYNECGVDSFAVDIVLYPATITPSLIVNGSNTYGCSPRPVTFVNNSVGGTLYTIDFGDGSNPYVTNKSNDTVSHRFNVPGSFLVTMRSINTCTDTTVTQSIVVHPTPVAGFVTNTPSYCLVDSVFFNNNSVPSTGAQYIWNFGDGTPISNMKDPVHKYRNSGSYDVNLIVNQPFSGGAICSDTITKKIVVHPMPTAVFTSNIGPINCAPFTFLGNSNPSNYAQVEWVYRKKGAEVIAIQSGYTANYSISSPGDYTVIMIGYNQFGCTDSAKVDFTVNASPNVKFTFSDSVYCSPGASVLFTNATTHSGTEALTYQWTVDGANVSTSSTSMTHLFTALVGIVSPSIYKVKLTSTSTATFCSSSLEKTIYVLPVPQVDKPADVFFCNGASSSVGFTSRNTFGTTTYDWINNNPSIGLPSSGTGPIGPFVGINTGFTPIIAKITVTPTFTYGGKSCSGPSETFNITINPSGNVDQPSNLLLCNGQLTAVNYSSQNTGGMTTYSWTNSNPSIGIISNNTGNIPTFIAINTTNKPVEAVISVTPKYVSNGLSCEGPSKNFTITVLPTVVVDQPADQVLCNNQSANFAFSSPTLGGSVTYRWVNDNPLIGLSLSGEGSTVGFIASNTGTKPVTANIRVTPSYAYGGQVCDGPSKTFKIIVNPSGQVNKLLNQVVCNGQPTGFIEFTTNRTGGQTTYLWTSDNTSIGIPANGIGSIPSFVAVNNGSIPEVANIIVTPLYTFQDLTCTGEPERVSITVNPAGQVNPVTSQEACNGTLTSPVLFTTNNSGGTTTYSWINSNPAIGLSSSGTGNIPSFRIVNLTDRPIVSVVTVVPTFRNGNVTCSGAPTSFTITALPLPQTNFRIVPDSGCAPMVINFTNLTKYADTYQWYLGNVPFSNAFNPDPMVLSDAGKTYIFELVATNRMGGCGPVSRKFTVKTLPTPKALFKMNGTDADTLSACKSINLNLSSQSYLNETSNRKGLSYQWFVNGIPHAETLDKISVYLQNDLNARDKIFEVKLKVYSASGCTDSISKYIKLFPAPLASFNILGTANNCAMPMYGLQKSIANLSVSKNPALYNWKIANKTSASTLHGVLISDDVSPNPIFSFPDNKSSSDSTYTLTLTVTSADGCIEDTAVNQIVYARPIVGFRMTDSASCRGSLNNTFIDLSQAPTSAIASRIWNFGDGSSSTLPVVSHSYNLYGTYWPSLSVKNARGCVSDTISKRVVVFGPPTASFVIPSNICLGTRINTTNLSQLGYGSTKFTQLVWDFGDGSLLNVADTNYTYTKPGIYTVTLTVKTDSSCISSTKSQSIVVIDKPKPDFIYDASCAGQVISFENKTRVGSGDTDYELVGWNFGDGGRSLVSNPQHIYKKAGTYSVTLVAKGRSCPQLSDSIRKSLTVKEPRADSVYERIFATRGQRFEVVAYSGGVSYLWTPSIGLANTTKQKTDVLYLKNDPSKIYYHVLIKDSSGCINRDSQEVWAFDTPDVYAPTAFTPNGDQANDVFIPYYINVKSLQSFRIYNRWGNKIFETNDMKKYWDATISGKQAPMETYTWIVECFDVNGNKLIRKGMVTLVRD